MFSSVMKSVSTHLFLGSRSGKENTRLAVRSVFSLFSPCCPRSHWRRCLIPEVLTEDAGKKVTGRLFDALFDAPGHVEPPGFSRRSRHQAVPEKR